MKGTKVHIARFFCMLSFCILMLHEVVPHHHHFELLDEIHNVLHSHEANHTSEHHSSAHHHETWKHHHDAEEHTDACTFSPQVQKQELAKVLAVLLTLIDTTPNTTITFTWDEDNVIPNSFYLIISSPLRGPPLS